MKKFFLLLSLMLFVAVEVNQAQLAQDSWSVGFGFRYPRLVSTNVSPLNSNYGGFISLLRNTSEHVGFRVKAGYSHLEGQYTDVNGFLNTSSTNAISGDLDILYYFVPCEPVSPYLFGGVGGVYRMLDKKATRIIDDNAFQFEFNAGGGVEWTLDEEWKLITEFGYHFTNNSEFDGALGLGEINGSDTYLGISVGLQYYFDKGQPSKYCQLYSGLVTDQRDLTDYGMIEDLIKKHIPKEVTKEVVVEKSPPSAAEEKWVLIGVNFDFNKSKLTAESYPILYDAAKTLLKNPDLKVEIQGYTDNVGSQDYNKKLAQKRADVVKNYLVGKGVAASRLTAVGIGEDNPLADNKTADGRAMNRRIEFKVQ